MNDKIEYRKTPDGDYQEYTVVKINDSHFNYASDTPYAIYCSNLLYVKTYSLKEAKLIVDLVCEYLEWKDIKKEAETIRDGNNNNRERI